MESLVRRVKTAVSSTVDTDRAVNRAVNRAMFVHFHVAGLAPIIGVNFPVISRASDRLVIVPVTAFYCVNIAVLDFVASRASLCVVSATAR